MGGSYSDLNVYFHTKKTDQYSGNGYTVDVTQGNFPECSNFVVFTHTIKFNSSFSGRNYNVLLYDGSSDKSKGSRVFGYYYPNNEKEVIEEVRSYYSVLAPNVPLVVSFKRGGNTYNCYFGKLKDAGWDRAYNIDRYSFGDPLSKNHLVGEFNKLLLNRKIRFRIGSEKEEISCYKQELDHQKKFRLVFLPRDKEPILGSDYLFAIDFVKNKPKIPGNHSHERQRFCEIAIEKDAHKIFNESEICNNSKNETCKKLITKYVKLKHTPPKVKRKNQIDEYFLRPFNGQIYDGIMVYLVRKKEKPPETLCAEEDDLSSALLLEFYDSCKSKTYIKRKDKEGYWWAEEKVEYTNDKKLLEELTKIDNESTECVTVILDKKESYLGAEVKSDEANNTYTKYTHKFAGSKKTVVLFERIKLKVGPFKTQEKEAKHVEVYYLKAGGNEDSQPFLIVFDQNGEDKDDKKKAYHFTNTDKFDDWQEFQFKEQEKTINGDKLIKKLYEKVKKIETNGSCVPELSLLRWYAYQILIDPEISKPPEPPTEPPERPPEEKPEDQPKPLPMPWIIGGSVGGVVFVGSSAVGYGIYWYNTTIKLLT